MGIVVAVLHSRLRHVKFPTVLSFFQGSRFIPFASTLVFAAVGQVFPFVWVWFSKGINALAGGISNLGMFGPFVYGTVEKLLIPMNSYLCFYMRLGVKWEALHPVSLVLSSMVPCARGPNGGGF